MQLFPCKVGNNDITITRHSQDHNGNFKSFNFEAQCHSVFQNVKIILEESGSSWKNLVDITILFLNLENFKASKSFYNLLLDIF